ncbi:MAG: selenocysteine-specific translation elongation factor [Myxococcota bacterium]|nr:selenocysteine-specific translation elongation factor [Myxococcota bacterium]
MAPADALVLGTAGHIDHGKTSLIRALTGVDTDRLPEEKARGITIDLGFAALDLEDDLRVAIVDVPGHEKLVRTMVSGAAGIDLVMLVVAADEGVMPQTREHVAICELLGIETGLVAITKSDLADEEVVELAQEEIADLLSDTALADVSMVPVSSETGEGIDRLREELAKLVRETRPRTPRFGPSRLSIDRAFAMKGFGTVVTGTLLGGRLDSGANVEVHPRGSKARVRGLQSHGEARDRVEPGARCAVNLQGVEVADVSRGDVIGRPDAIISTQTLDVELLWLPGAPAAEGTVSIEFLSGTAERRARLAPIGDDEFTPGAKSFARIHIDGDPVPLVVGDRFIARGFARLEGSGATLGGGVILDVAPPHRRRSDPDLVRELTVLAAGELRSAVRERVIRTGMSGAAEKDIALEVGLETHQLRGELAALESEGCVVKAGSGRWLGEPVVARMEARLLEVLDEFHRTEPLRPGMSRSTLRGQLPDNVRAEGAELAIKRLEDKNEVCVGGEYAWRSSFSPTLDAASEALVATLREQASDAGLEPPSLKDWAERLDTSVETLRDLMAYLERGGEIVRAPGDLFFSSAAIDALKGRVADHFAQTEELDTQTYKDIIGTSRRTAMPLMELLDDLHVTRRVGDVRVARKA